MKMKLLVATPTFHGTVTPPASKSHTIRALICAALAEKPSYITDPLVCGDTMSAIRVLRRLGVTVSKMGETPLILRIAPPAGGLLSFADSIGPGETILDLGNSGSLLYFLGMILAVARTRICLTGDTSLQNRPVEPLLELYRQAGIRYSAQRPGTRIVPPLRFCGPLKAGTFHLTGPFSQPMSGLLFAAPLLNGTSRITFNQPGELPYLRMTCEWLHTAGIKLLKRKNNSFETIGPQRYQGFKKTIPGDWSAALFLLAAAVICNQPLTVTNLNLADTQGDSKALAILHAMGANVRYDTEGHTVSVSPVSGKLKGGSFDCADIPDTVPVLAATALFCVGETRLLNAGVCRFKESDRLHAAAEELAKFGAHITEGEDFLCIEGTGGKDLHPATVHSCGDHRIAMMLAVTACGIAARTDNTSSGSEHSDPYAGQSCIENFDCVNVSYPHFVEDMKKAGAAFKADCG